MRPDTRQHLTACTGPSEENGISRHSARSPAAVKPLRGSSTPFRPLRVTAAADRAGSPCGPAGRLALRSRVTIVALGEPLRCCGAPLEWTEGRRRRLRKGLHFRRRPHTSVHDDRNDRSTSRNHRSRCRNPCSTSRNRCSTSAEIRVHLPPESVFKISRNTQFRRPTSNGAPLVEANRQRPSRRARCSTHPVLALVPPRAGDLVERPAGDCMSNRGTRRAGTVEGQARAVAR